MKRYRIRVCLECEYDDIEAENEEDAFLQASEDAMSGGSWRLLEIIEVIRDGR